MKDETRRSGELDPTAHLIEEARERKEAELDAIRQRLIVEGKSEEDDWEIDPGILETLVVLNALDFHTCGSCEGHLPESEDDFYPNNGPYVVIATNVPGSDLSEEELDARAYRYENDELTEEDIALSERQEKQLRFDQRRLVETLDAFYSNRRPVHESIRLVISRPLGEVNIFTLASQGAWAEYSTHERQRFLLSSQAEMDAFTKFLRKEFASL